MNLKNIFYITNSIKFLLNVGKLLPMSVNYYFILIKSFLSWLIMVINQKVLVGIDEVFQFQVMKMVPFLTDSKNKMWGGLSQLRAILFLQSPTTTHSHWLYGTKWPESSQYNFKVSACVYDCSNNLINLLSYIPWGTK